jgi:outer membrane protein OmpU
VNRDLRAQETTKTQERIMKKVLLTTTALVMTAGYAAADISMSGTMQVALTDDNGAETAAVTDYQLTTGFDFNVAVSAETDNGITMSSTFDMGAGSLVDYNDDDEIEAQAPLAAGDSPTVTLGYAGYTIKADANGIDNLWDADATDQDISLAGSVAGFDFTVASDFDDDSASYKVGYTMGDITITATGTNKEGNYNTSSRTESAAKLAVSYKVSDTLTLDASTNDTGLSTVTDNDNTVGLTYKMDAITLTYTSIDPQEANKDWGDEWDAKIAYSAGALTASFATDEADATTMIAEYDLGGGATFFAASHDKAGTATDMTTMGINFTF